MILSAPMGFDQANDTTAETRRGGFSGILSVCWVGTAAWNSGRPLAGHTITSATRLDGDIAGYTSALHDYADRLTASRGEAGVRDHQ